MADDLPPVRGEAFTFYVTLVSQANGKIFQTNPTLAAGDAKVSIDGGALNNPATLPDVMPAGGKQVRVQLSGVETDGAAIAVLFSDVAGDEWCDGYWEFMTAPQQIGDLATSVALAVAQADLDDPNQYKADVSLLAVEGNVEGHAAAALTAYDPPTRTEATSDKDAILTAVGLIAAAVWTVGARTLTSFGTLTTDTAAAVWAYATRTLTSFGALVADVWAYTTRTLTQSGTQVAAAVSGSDISLKSYTTWIINLTGIGDISDRTKLYFTAKRDLEDDLDAASDLQIVESKPAAASDGLLYIDRATATDASKGSILVTDEAVGNLTVTVSALVTGIGKRSVRYGVKKVTATAVQAMVEGNFEVDAPTARVTS